MVANNVTFLFVDLSCRVASNTSTKKAGQSKLIRLVPTHAVEFLVNIGMMNLPIVHSPAWARIYKGTVRRPTKSHLHWREHIFFQVDTVCTGKSCYHAPVYLTRTMREGQPNHRGNSIVARTASTTRKNKEKKKLA